MILRSRRLDTAPAEPLVGEAVQKATRRIPLVAPLRALGDITQLADALGLQYRDAQSPDDRCGSEAPSALLAGRESIGENGSDRSREGVARQQ